MEEEYLEDDYKTVGQNTDEHGGNIVTKWTPSPDSESNSDSDSDSTDQTNTGGEDEDVDVGLFVEAMIRCIENKETTLKISELRIKSIPDIISQCDTLKELIISDTAISKINNLPKNLVNLEVSNSRLDTVIWTCFPDTLTQLSLMDNYISDVNFITQSLRSLVLTGNCIKCLRPDPNNLVHLGLGDNKLTVLNDFPFMKSLKSLDISKNNICEIDVLVDKTPTLKRLDVTECAISKIGTLPPRLEMLVASNNDIKSISCEFPESLEEINLADNEIRDQYPPIPKTVTRLDFSNNNLVRYSYYHVGLKRLDLRGNKALRITPSHKSAISFVMKAGGSIFYDEPSRVTRIPDDNNNSISSSRSSSSDNENPNNDRHRGSWYNDSSDENQRVCDSMSTYEKIKQERKKDRDHNHNHNRDREKEKPKVVKLRKSGIVVDRHLKHTRKVRL